jgi:hypothetical protein
MAREKALGVHLLELGSAEAAEEFYAKPGYTGQLLIKSQKLHKTTFYDCYTKTMFLKII